MLGRPTLCTFSIRVQTGPDDARTPRAEAEDANLAKSRFLATISHELRTPLNAIVGYSDLLAQGVHGPLTEKQSGCVARIRASGHHLAALVDDVLDLSRIESGGLSISRTEVPLGPTVAEALDMVRHQAAEQGAEIISRVDPDEPAACLGDPDRTRQILVNLLSNAVKFGGANGRVEVRCRLQASRPDGAEGPWRALDVEDTGPGIAADQRTRIFEPFVQVDDSATRTTGGAGLGLAISRQLARIMEGDLTVESQPGDGARFTLWLRAADARDPGR